MRLKPGLLLRALLLAGSFLGLLLLWSSLSPRAEEPLAPGRPRVSVRRDGAAGRVAGECLYVCVGRGRGRGRGGRLPGLRPAAPAGPRGERGAAGPAPAVPRAPRPCPGGAAAGPGAAVFGWAPRPGPGRGAPPVPAAARGGEVVVGVRAVRRRGLPSGGAHTARVPASPRGSAVP